jgi:endonuclease/exonuclease/phosphatase family metal-dependent hydrolase
MTRPRVRIMSYNVHRCIGADGKLAPQRIAEVIGRYEPDLVGLQELDIGRARTEHVDQPLMLAELVQMHHRFHPAIEVAEERYGDAILSRFPLDLVRAGPLPTWPQRRRALERRGALWARIECHGRTVQVLNTHLGLDHRERLAQAEALLGPEWLGHPDCVGPRILCGDFNVWPGTLPYGRLRRALHDAQDLGLWPWRRNTFPARCPLVSIDHVFHSPDLRVLRVSVPRNRLTRIASDHLPIIVELGLP